MRFALAACMLVGCGRVGFGSEKRDAMVDASSMEIVQLSFRGSAPCVRTADGQLACWGENENGQLGRGNVSLFEGPALVPIENVALVATGENTSFAIDGDGALWGWGDNQYGQVGLGTTATKEPSPRQVPLPPVVDVATGEYHSCAVTVDGEVYCWGNNYCGQLGTGTTTSTHQHASRGSPPLDTSRSTIEKPAS